MNLNLVSRFCTQWLSCQSYFSHVPGCKQAVSVLQPCENLAGETIVGTCGNKEKKHLLGILSTS